MSKPSKKQIEARQLQLVQHSQMLGRIAGEVGDWCRDPESTTYEAVIAMKAELYRLRASYLDWELDEEIRARRAGR